MSARFGGIMILGGLGAIVHAVVPGLCTTTGSDTVAKLHAEMVAKRRKKQAAQAQMKSVEYVI